MKPRSDAMPRRIMMTVTEVARYLHVHPNSVYRLIRERRVPVFKIASEYRFDKRDLEAWIADHEEARAKNARAYVNIETFEQSLDRIFKSAKGVVAPRPDWSRLIQPN